MAFTPRSLATRFGTIEELSVPRVREGSFRPSCLPPYRTCNAILGIDEDGKKEIFTLWMSGSNGESSLLWQEVLQTLRERGLKQVLLIAGDGLTGLRKVAKKVYPKADFQTRLLHKVRASLL